MKRPRLLARKRGGIPGTKPGTKQSSKRGALVIVAALLIASAMLRVGVAAGRAVTREQPAPTAAMASAAMDCKTPEDLRATLEMFQQREARIAEREARIADRMQALAVADQEITRRLAELAAAEGDLRKLLTIADEAAEGDIARLTAVYEAMKPKDAAPLFEEMAPEFAAGFLGRMRADAAARIMAGLSPRAAHSISVVIAGRNAGIPKE